MKIDLSNLPSGVKLDVEEEFRNNLFLDAIKKSGSIIILGECLGLKHLGIDCKLKPIKLRKNRNGDITLTWRLDITKVRDIKKFKEKVEFLLKEKNNKLDEILLQNRKYDRFQDTLEILEKFSKGNKTFTYQEFAKLLGVHPDRGLFHLRRLIVTRNVSRCGRNQYRSVFNDNNSG